MIYFYPWYVLNHKHDSEFFLRFFKTTIKRTF